MYRGSRKHILDWTDRQDFDVQLPGMILPVQVKLTAGSMWMPHGYRFPDEARLETFGPRFLSGHPAWQALSGWWLRHEHRANTPNWDLAVGCEIDGQPGLIFVEVKANTPELKTEGKSIAPDASPNSEVRDDRCQSAPLAQIPWPARY